MLKNPLLIREVWIAINIYIVELFLKFQTQVTECYQNEKLPIDQLKINEIFQIIPSGRKIHSPSKSISGHGSNFSHDKLFSNASLSELGDNKSMKTESVFSGN